MISVILNDGSENLVIDTGSSVFLIDSSFVGTLRGTPSLIEEKIDEKRTFHENRERGFT